METSFQNQLKPYGPPGVRWRGCRWAVFARDLRLDDDATSIQQGERYSQVLTVAVVCLLCRRLYLLWLLE